MKKPKSFVSRMLSSDASASTMRVLVTACIINAIWISQVVLCMWVLSLFGIIVKPVDFTPITYLIGLFLSSLTFKAVQSFSKNDKQDNSEEEEDTRENSNG